MARQRTGWREEGASDMGDSKGSKGIERKTFYSCSCFGRVPVAAQSGEPG